jgi:hypothetical protein
MHPQQSPSEATQAYVTSVAARLAADACQTWWEDWGGVPVLVGRRADFRLRWMAKMHLFTVVVAVPEITMPTIGTFTFQAMEYAKRVKGGLPAGLQTGICLFPVLVSDRPPRVGHHGPARRGRQRTPVRGALPAQGFRGQGVRVAHAQEGRALPRRQVTRWPCRPPSRPLTAGP